VGIEGNDQLGSRDGPPKTQVNPIIGTHHPAEKEIESFTGTPVFGRGEEIGHTLREGNGVSGFKGFHKLGQCGTDIRIVFLVERDKKRTQRAVAPYHPSHRSKKRNKVFRPIKAVIDPFKTPTLASRFEGFYETIRTFPNEGKHFFKDLLKERNPAIGQDRRKKTHNFNI